MREGLIYMLKNPGADQFNHPLLREHEKIARGWNHPQTARLLCPMRMLDIFDSDPLLVALILLARSHIITYRSFVDKVKEGQITITAAKLPAFLYDESMLDPTKKTREDVTDSTYFYEFFLIRYSPIMAPYCCSASSPLALTFV